MLVEVQVVPDEHANADAMQVERRDGVVDFGLVGQILVCIPARLPQLRQSFRDLHVRTRLALMDLPDDRAEPLLLDHRRRHRQADHVPEGLFVETDDGADALRFREPVYAVQLSRAMGEPHWQLPPQELRDLQQRSLLTR
jgi:hypothetical protein